MIKSIVTIHTVHTIQVQTCSDIYELFERLVLIVEREDTNIA